MTPPKAFALLPGSRPLRKSFAALSIPKPTALPAGAAPTPTAPGSVQTAAPPAPDAPTAAPSAQAADVGETGGGRTAALPGGSGTPGPGSTSSGTGTESRLTAAPTAPQADPPAAHSGPTREARILQTSQPPYPPGARQDGVEGTVTLRVWLDAGGAAQRVEVSQSSGDRRLDEAARQEVLSHWRFAPRLEGGTAAAATLRVRVVFTLTDEL